jgi:glutamate-1-semialdehyde 2,1-aminomutase
MAHYTHILGHGNKKIANEVKQILDLSSHFGTINIYQYNLAKTIKEAIPSIDLLRFCCSGTEATMYAIRVAKAYTEKPMIVKIDGGWHGANSELAYNIKPPFNHVDNQLSIPFNNIDVSYEILNKVKDKIAAIIVEPFMGSAGAIAGKKEYLRFLRNYTNESGILLIFDETISAFRFCYGSLGIKAGIIPDLITLGKIIGGGFPIGAYGGKKEIMETIEKKHLIIGGGTFSANPVTMTAGTTMLALLKNMDYIKLNDAGDDIRRHINNIISNLNIKGFASGYGSQFSLIFLQDSFNNEYILDEPSTFLSFVDDQKNEIFNIIALINDMITMHNGGALSFMHLNKNTIEKIKKLYSQSLKNLKEIKNG